MFFPTVILLAFIFIIVTLILNKNKRITLLLFVAIIMITIFDLFRFGLKFTPFTKSDYLFPKTKSLSFLQQNAKNYRIMTSDPRILPPNFSLIYKLQSINGYDPLYLMRYGELIAASERGIPNISTPFGFNRIINPQNFNSEIIDLLGVKYILSLSDLKDKKLIKVFQEGKTRIYENKNVFPRAFFVKKIHYVNNKVEAITALFNKNIDFRNEVIIENWPDSIKKLPLSFSQGEAEIVEYSPNKIIIKTQNEGEGFLLLTDNYYSNWRAKISSGNSMSESKIYRVDFNFRGIIVPKGEYTVEFYVGLI